MNFNSLRMYSGFPKGFNRVFILILFTWMALIYSISELAAQNTTLWIEQPALSQQLTFSPQPKITFDHFKTEPQIRSFNATKSFEEFSTNKLFLDIKAYPNPASEYIMITIPEDGELVLSSDQGHTMEVLTVFKGEAKLDLTVLSNGFYIVQLNTSSETLSKRILVRH